MSKIMSVFEKLNFVEKVNNEIPTTDSTEDTEEAPVKIIQNDGEPNTEAADFTKENEQEINIVSDRNMRIEEIYTKFGIKVSGVNTIFMLEKFISALPEKLPIDVKKESVINILDASNTELGTLISDGEKRLDILNSFAKKYSDSTAQAIEKCKSEIVKLNNLIKNYEEQIYLKESMLLEQNNVIKAETEKISGTINIFKDSN